MNKPLLLTAAGIALFAAGYGAGARHESANSSGGKTGPVAAAAAARAGEFGPKSGAASAEKEVRAFAPGRPFAKGGAKAWLLSLAAQMGGDRNGREIQIMDMAQLFMTMDEACAAETCEALQELLMLHEAGDPTLKAINDADDMGEGAYMIAVFRLSQLNPAAALEALKKLSKGVPDEATKFVFGRLAAQDPARAEAMVPTLPQDQQEDALEGIFHAMTAKDPVAALAFAEKYSDKISDYERDKVIKALMDRDPQQGIATAIRFTEKTKDAQSVRQAFNVWMEKDQNAALAWAAQYHGPGQTAVQGQLIQRQADSDPQAAVEAFARLQQSATNKDELRLAADAITHKLAEKDPASAQGFITTLPEGKVRDSATDQLAQTWTEEDPAAASEWIRTLPVGEPRNEAARILIRKISTRDPASAYEWARSISNEASRKEMMEQVMHVWEDVDPEAAREAAREPGPAHP